VTGHPRAEAAGGRKAPRHEVAVCWAVAGSERYGDSDVSGELVCGREVETPSASMAVGIDREAATWIAEPSFSGMERLSPSQQCTKPQPPQSGHGSGGAQERAPQHVGQITIVAVAPRESSQEKKGPLWSDAFW
jgi:hypothetical protein